MSAENFRKYYKPVQPSVRKSAENVIYEEILPAAGLQAFIYCYWELKTASPLTAQFNYKVVADGCIDIFFELENPAASFVMGFCNKYADFLLENTFHYIGIRFLPTFFTQFFGVNAAELTNKAENLNAVVAETARFIAAEFSPALTFPQIKKSLDAYFLAHPAKTDFKFDKRLYRALEIIFRNYGVVSIEADLTTGISPRQLRRLFDFYIGDSAKTFSKVVRFQNILNAKPSVQSLRANKLFFDAGYYDQAHFIKEFKNLYGVTPNQAFNR